MQIEQLPPSITGPSAWFGPQFSQSRDWQVQLTEDEIREIERAARRCLNEDPDIAAIGRDRFDLPTLAPRLAAIHQELIDGGGVMLVRALPVGDWPLELSAAAFYGLGVHLGNARPQNASGHLLGHVIDMGKRSDDPGVRIYQTHERQTFHTDSCDIVGLLCLRQAKSGGDSAIVSSNTIYNVMRRECPALAAALFDPIATDRRGEVPPGQKPYFEIPVFNWYAGLLSSIYQRQYIDSAQRFPDAMRLTPLHVEALDRFDALANDTRLNFLMRLSPGDMQFVHNHTLLHDRTAFVDDPDPARKRHLLRLWLASPRARALPPVFAQRYGSVDPGVRGGGLAPPSLWNAPLSPA